MMHIYDDDMPLIFVFDVLLLPLMWVAVQVLAHLE